MQQNSQRGCTNGTRHTPPTIDPPIKTRYNHFTDQISIPLEPAHWEDQNALFRFSLNPLIPLFIPTPLSTLQPNTTLSETLTRARFHSSPCRGCSATSFPWSAKATSFRLLFVVSECCSFFFFFFVRPFSHFSPFSPLIQQTKTLETARNRALYMPQNERRLESSEIEMNLQS